MKPRMLFIAVVGTALLLAGSTGCIEREGNGDPAGGGEQASDNQTEAVLARVLPSTVSFSMTAQQIVELSLTAGGGSCPRIPGAQSASLCSDPGDGVACEVNSSTTELRFNDCNAGGTLIDGTIRVSGPSRGPLEARFDLSLGGRSVDGRMTIAFGSCDRLSYNDLSLNEAEFSSTLGGELQNCNGAPGGNFTATVNADGVQPFVARVTFAGNVATVAITDLETQTPLYQCTWTPSSGSTDCQ